MYLCNDLSGEVRGNQWSNGSRVRQTIEQNITVIINECDRRLNIINDVLRISYRNVIVHVCFNTDTVYSNNFILSLQYYLLTCGCCGPLSLFPLQPRIGNDKAVHERVILNYTNCKLIMQVYVCVVMMYTIRCPLQLFYKYCSCSTSAVKR